MNTNTMSQMERNALHIFLALRTPGHQATVLIGQPGGGKTTLVRHAALALGVDDDHFERWSLGQHTPEDLNGWPTPREDGLHFYPPFRIKALNDGKPACWFLDDFNQAPRSVQGAALKPLDSGMVGEEVLGPAVRIIGAMNPVSTAADANDIAHALANRVLWVPFEMPSADDHVEFMLRRGSRCP